MAIDTTSLRTRRAILVGALGGMAASVAAAAGRASPVEAAYDDVVHVGHTYTSTFKTGFKAHGQDALWGTSDSATGVYGSSGSSVGVSGHSKSRVGVYGYSASGLGVEGLTYASDWPAILGQSQGANTGVQGMSTTTIPLPAAPAKTGVYGYADQDAAAVGVKGQSLLGTGGLFSAGPKGTSLRATGRVTFDKAAGVATVAAVTNKVTVTPGTDLTATSAVVATLQGIPSGSGLVKSVAVNPTANNFTIYLTANTTHATRVAWHVFG